MKREDMQEVHFSKQCTAKNLILFIQRILMKGKHSYEIRCVNHLDFQKPLTNVFLTSALLHNIYTIQENNIVKFHLPRPLVLEKHLGLFLDLVRLCLSIIYSVLKSQFINSL